jgi:GNAT superfamily N-acetyltransferase/predicted enzyme related to lactoylglutathione lyase
MVFQYSVPILYSSDVKRSIQYYTEVLGFDRQWIWGDTPDFGGVSRDHVQVFFCRDGQGHPGTWLSIMVDDIDTLHERVLTKGGVIVSPPENKEWGLCEMLVQDQDGHYIRFGQSISSHDKKSGNLPTSIVVIDRSPSVAEYEELMKAVGWKKQGIPGAEVILKAPVYAAVAEDNESNKTVGCVLLLGDGASFYYVKDMMVLPEYQRKHIGTMLMHRLNQWLERNAPVDAMVGLYTGQNLAPFYRQFGFGPAFGMTRHIHQRPE